MYFLILTTSQDKPRSKCIILISRIFAAAEAPIIWDPVDVTPVRYPDGTMGIPKAVIESVNKHKIGLKSPLMTPVGKGFRSLNLALRKGK